jgi:hypothetical protein
MALAGLIDVVAAAMTMVATDNTRHIFVLLDTGALGCFAVCGHRQCDDTPRCSP